MEMNMKKQHSSSSRYWISLVVFILVIISSKAIQAQAYLETFGQNRVQLRAFDWRYFNTHHFKIYHYDAAGRQLARYVAEQAEKDIKIIEKKLGGRFPERFNIVLYNSFEDYRQTNIGRKQSSAVQDNPSGRVDLVGDNLVVYFTGVHTDVHRQLRAGMARVVMERMVFGESLKEMVKNAIALDLPSWVTTGYIAYLVDGWDTESETQWKNYLQANPNKSYYQLSESNPELAGKAFWKFIAVNYGENNVKNLLYTMQMKTKLNKALEQTIGMKTQQAFDSILHFYQQVYAADAQVLQQPDTSQAILEIKVPNDRTILRNIQVSPRGHDVAYVTWLDGEYQVYIQHTTGEQTKIPIISGGIKDFNEPPDPNYPIMAWNNTGYKLAILYKRKGKTRLRIYDGLKSKIQEMVIPSNRFDRVLGATFMEDDLRLVFSAIKKSQTDLYEFRLKGAKLTKITNDLWDDIEPTYVSGGARKGIVFLSNRPEPNLKAAAEINELPNGPMNAYFYDTKTKSTQLLQLSTITKGNITQPIPYGSDNFAFLYDTSGIVNKYVVLFGRTSKNMDSAYAVPVTNYSNSILTHQYNPASKKAVEVMQEGKNYQVYFNPIQIPQPNTAPKELFKTTLSQPSAHNFQNSYQPATITNITPIVTNTSSPLPPTNSVHLQSGSVFQSEFSESPSIESPEPTDTNAIVLQEDTTSKIPELSTLTDEDSFLVDSTYFKMKAKPYRYSFKPDYFSFRLDNTILFTKYQPIDQSFATPPVGAMLTISLNDAFENIKLTGGVRLPINFSGMNYFLQYENVTRRVDWSVLLLRTENYQKVAVGYTDSSNRLVYVNPDQIQKTITNLIQGTAIYPFDRVRSIHLHAGIRQDNINYKAQDIYALVAANPDKKYWLLSRAEYIHDNTIAKALNIYNGLRMKIYGEYFYQLTKPNGGLYNLGIDVRYYKKIVQNSIWATRFAYAHSGGNKKINYVMGGVDNWLFAKQDVFGPSPNQDFGFQALTTNLRGYKQNARSGNSYGLVNTELRVPVLPFFVKRPIQNATLKNLQLVGFLDVGNAWNGWIPTDDEAQRSYTFPQYQVAGQSNSVSVTVAPPRMDIGVGYGAGLRTMLLGYFIRLDAAWNIEGSPKPIWYFSLGTDF